MRLDVVEDERLQPRGETERGAFFERALLVPSVDHHALDGPQARGPSAAGAMDERGVVLRLPDRGEKAIDEIRRGCVQVERDVNEVEPDAAVSRAK